VGFNQELAHKKKRALFVNFLVIFGTWVPFVFISILSNSITLIAQMLMGGAQSLSVYLSLKTTQKSYKKHENLIKQEIINARIMVAVFLVSFVVVLFIAIKRFFMPKELEFYASMAGVVGNSIAVFVNFFQWRKNLKLSKEEFSPVLESQWTLFRIKTFTALTAVVSIIVYYLLPNSILHDYVDPVFSMGLAALILYSAFALLRKAKFGLKE
jgi:Co/Zn/Cd efflux system component